MTFINWSDPEEMFGLLSEYVLDERSDPHNDRARTGFLTELSADLQGLARHVPVMSTAEVIEKLRALHASQADDRGDDPVMTHLEDCIDELERIKLQSM